MTLADQEDRTIAARDRGRNLVVTAGAGTGKTSLLVERLLHLVCEHGLRLERIAAMTFTRKAAAELRDRLEEALERLVALAARPATPLYPFREADRVFARLRDGRLAAMLAARSHAALEALDAMSLGTIHAFAGEILRRHPDEAGLDPQFEIDESAAGHQLFTELWAAEVEAAFGGREAPPAWRALLGRTDLAAIGALAHELAGDKVPLEALAEGCVEAQRAHATAFAAELTAEVDAIEAASRRLSGTRAELFACLERMRKQLRTVASGAELPRPVGEDWPGSCKLGAKVEESPEKSDLERRVKRVLEQVANLSACVPAVVAEAASALRGFAARYREEHRRRGLVSQDGLIVLARDLLRDHVAVRRKEGARFDQLLIDELQDTDPLQYEVAFFLAEAPAERGSGASDAYRLPLTPGKLFLVGDWKQSIYRFRGADLAAYRRAVAAVEGQGGAVLSLRANFRSVPEVVDPINRLFEPQLDGYESLAASRSAAGAPRVEVWSAGAPDQSADARRDAEAAAIAAWARGAIDRGEHAAQDIAVLFHARTGLDGFLEALRREDVPCVVEGGKGFYSRHEVELLLALLRSVVSPADPVPLVLTLRSAVFGVPDAELAAHAGAFEPARRRRAAGAAPTWSLWAEPDAKQLPNLARALETLRDLHRRFRDQPLDRLARAILEETPVRLAMAASHGGPQRLLNLEKAVSQIASLAMDPSLGAEEILERIEAEEAREAQEGDSPLADETVDAVRVLTVHAAKGLEWPVVIVPDLASSEGAGRQNACCVLIEPSLALGVKVGDAESPAWRRHRFHDARERSAERDRLLYVAMTRARERLILVAGAKPRIGSAPWLQTLGQWGYEVAAGFPADESFCGGQVLHLRKPVEPRPPRRTRKEAVDPRLLAAARAFAAAQRSAQESRRDPLRSPSSLREERLPPAADVETAAGDATPAPADRAVAMAAGTAMHLLLEAWDRKDARWLEEAAPRAARVAAAEARCEHQPVLARLAALLAGLRSSRRLARLADETALARELPLLHTDREGRVWDGTIDLVAGSVEAPEIVDYKTDLAPLAELEKEYGEQLGKYAEAVQRALGLLVAPRARVEPLR